MKLNSIIYIFQTGVLFFSDFQFLFPFFSIFSLCYSCKNKFCFPRKFRLVPPESFAKPGSFPFYLLLRTNNRIILFSSPCTILYRRWTGSEEIVQFKRFTNKTENFDFSPSQQNSEQMCVCFIFCARNGRKTNFLHPFIDQNEKLLQNKNMG